jgi:hypothetical protein
MAFRLEKKIVAQAISPSINVESPSCLALRQIIFWAFFGYLDFIQIHFSKLEWNVFSGLRRDPEVIPGGVLKVFSAGVDLLLNVAKFFGCEFGKISPALGAI